MRHEFAAYFEPTSGASSVPVAQYVRAIEAIGEAIAGLRLALAPEIAEEHKWPLAQVRRALEFSIGPTRAGSLAVPFVAGATENGAMLMSDPVALTFWKNMGQELAAVKARTARGKKWKSVAVLTALEPALRAHSQRRRAGHLATVALIGRITSLTLEPLSFVLTMGGSKRTTVQIPTSLRDAARGHWGGGEVIVDVEGLLSAEGDVAEPRATNIHAAATAAAAFDSFNQTFGSLRAILGTEEATEYLKTLRPTH